MKITVKYFASIREAVGVGSEQVVTLAANLAALRNELIHRGEPHASALAPGRALRMALNQVMANGDAVLKEGDEVAFFPPVTGG